MRVDNRKDDDKYYFANVLEGAPITFDTLGVYTDLTFNTVSDAISGTLPDGNTVNQSIGQTARTLGFTSVNGGGGASYVVTSGEAADGILIINMDNGLQLERLSIPEQLFNTKAEAEGALWLGIGDKAKTTAYTTNLDKGGRSYNVVSTGTGTSDGASYSNISNGNQLELVPTESITLQAAGGIVDGSTSDTEALEAAAVASNTIIIDGVAQHNSNIDLPTGEFKTFQLDKGRIQGFDIVGDAKLTGMYLEETTLREIDFDYPLGDAPLPVGNISKKLIYREDLNGELQVYYASKCPLRDHLIIQRMFKGIGAGASSDYDLFRCAQVYKSNESFTFNSQNITVNGTNIPVTITPSAVGDSGAVAVTESFDIYSIAPSTEGFTIDLSGQAYQPYVRLAFRGTAGGPTFTITSGTFSRTYTAVDAGNKPVIVDVPFSDSIVIVKTGGGASLAFFGYNFSRVGEEEVYSGNNIVYMSTLGSSDTYVNNTGASDYAIRPENTNLFAGSFHGYEVETVPTRFYFDEVESAISDFGFKEALTVKTIQETQILSTIDVVSEHTFSNDGAVTKSFIFTNVMECNRAYFGMATFGKRFSDVIFPPNFNLGGLPSLPESGDAVNYAVGNTNTFLLKDDATNDSVYCKFPKYDRNSKVGPIVIKPTADTTTGYNKPYGVRLYDFISNVGSESFIMETRYY